MATMDLRPEHFPAFAKDLRESKMLHSYACPELWLCQDYPVIYQHATRLLLNEHGELLLPPLLDGDWTEALKQHRKSYPDTPIRFAPHDISERAPKLWEMELEEVDNNYLNSTEVVVGLRGNKLKVLRHNVNQMLKVVEAESIVRRPLVASDIEQAIELCQQYRSQATEVDDFGYNQKMLENLFNFHFVHQGYFRDGEMIAFNIGAPISEKVMGFLVSKSSHQEKYLVDYVRWDFHVLARSLRYCFVNDGSDLDSEGLAQLKRKFAPISVLPVFEVWW